ncbi:unnamed protein product [Rotaria sordida]|uniref:Uncharacterized protein n=1 Tax=Rotaria sordida TaxID=392033 RepID=A0A814S109_9BILA|nr:unnamed protein product [Rotaria sordida]CAF1371537.1 unnamed protein product [Rotaria sordida]
MRRRFRSTPYSLPNGGGHHAPHINITHDNGDLRIELKKNIQSDKSDEIQRAGRIMSDYRGPKSETQPPNTIGSFKFILRTESSNDMFDFLDYLDTRDSLSRYEHLYEWEVPNSPLRVSVRNRRSDGKRPRDTNFVVEVRVFKKDIPTDEGIMMAWHNFTGTFVENRRQRRNRIEEMRRNGFSYAPETLQGMDVSRDAPIPIPVLGLELGIGIDRNWLELSIIGQEPTEIGIAQY